jgi:hypothetical protein
MIGLDGEGFHTQVICPGEGLNQFCSYLLGGMSKISKVVRAVFWAIILLLCSVGWYVYFLS